MFKIFGSAWKVTDLRKKILFTLFIIVLYRIGCAVPVPFVDSAALRDAFSSAEGSMFQYLNILSGDAFSKATLFALSITPYITASIVMQLLTIAIPALERLQKEDDGRKKINTITRYVTVALALITAFGYYMTLKNNSYSTGTGTTTLLTDTSFFAAVVIIACYVAGAVLIMWLGEKINVKGIGNGISIMLFANIVASIPALFQTITESVKADFENGTFTGTISAVVAIVLVLAIITFVVFMTKSERRLPVQYAKRVVGRKMYGGQSTYLPLNLNMNGVMPIIFASSIVSLPATIGQFFSPKDGTFWSKFLNFFSYQNWIYPLLLFLLIIAFAYFYLAISFNTAEVANNLKKNGGFIPGIRPGKPTSDFINKSLNKITLIGAFFLGFIAVLPYLINAIPYINFGSFTFGGTSLLIVVGVALETVRDIESQITMRHYKGFLE